jgi:hypothetical protein
LFFSLAPQTPPTAPAPKTPLSASENLKFSFTNAEKSQPQLQKQISTSKEEKTSVESPSSTSNATSQYDNKPSIFGNFNGNSGTSIFGSSTPLNNGSGSIFGGGASLKSSTNTNGGFTFPGFGSTTTASTPSTGFQFSTPAATSTSTTTTTTNTSSTFSFGATAAASANKPLFGNSPKFSFSDLAKQTSSDDKPTSNGTEQRGMNINLNFLILFICFFSLCWSRFTYIWHKFNKYNNNNKRK